MRSRSRRRALDDPAVTSDAGAVFGLPSRDHRLDPALPDQPAVLVVVVAAVSDDAVGPPPRPAGPAADRRHLVEQCEQLGDVVAIAACERPGERQAAAGRVVLRAEDGCDVGVARAEADVA